MLPVAHQACTLATGALRSSFTINVRPSGRTHFLAVFAGNVMTVDSSTREQLCKFTMVKTNAETSPATLTQYTIFAYLIPKPPRRSIRKFSALANPGEGRLSFQGRKVSRTLPENHKPL